LSNDKSGRLQPPEPAVFCALPFKLDFCYTENVPHTITDFQRNSNKAHLVFEQLELGFIRCKFIFSVRRPQHFYLGTLHFYTIYSEIGRTNTLNVTLHLLHSLTHCRCSSVLFMFLFINHPYQKTNCDLLLFLKPGAGSLEYTRTKIITTLCSPKAPPIISMVFMTGEGDDVFLKSGPFFIVLFRIFLHKLRS